MKKIEEKTRLKQIRDELISMGISDWEIRELADCPVRLCSSRISIQANPSTLAIGYAVIYNMPLDYTEMFLRDLKETRRRNHEKLKP